ncbi:MAG: hypothetical protein Q8R76_10590 [Candidatus Omnitrophota bacterium]|nr:hypothetical protein [Candidatus Omnitrophota bacterium]
MRPSRIGSFAVIITMMLTYTAPYGWGSEWIAAPTGYVPTKTFEEVLAEQEIQAVKDRNDGDHEGFHDASSHPLHSSSADEDVEEDEDAETGAESQVIEENTEMIMAFRNALETYQGVILSGVTSAVTFSVAEFKHK